MTMMFLHSTLPLWQYLTESYLAINMRLSIPTAVGLVLPSAVRGANIIMGNDDGWAEINLRVFYDALNAAGETAVVSAPAVNKSGSSALLI